MLPFRDLIKLSLSKQVMPVLLLSLFLVADLLLKEVHFYCAGMVQNFLVKVFGLRLPDNWQGGFF
jgi:hypothetical protein